MRISSNKAATIMNELHDIKNTIKKYMEENNDLRGRLNETEKKVERLTGEKEGLGTELRDNQ